MMKKVHFWVGIVGILVFIATGQYMQHFHAALEGMADAPRLLYRSAHIYLLLSSILNLAIGIYIPAKNNEFTWPKYVYSAAILFAPLIITIGFFMESSMENLYRPFTSFAVIMLFAASVFVVLISAYKQYRKMFAKEAK